MVYEGNKRCAGLYDYMRDSIVIVSEPISGPKNFHKWAQFPTEALQIISRLTFENQIVLDPMMGSGTTGIAPSLKTQTKICGGRKPTDFAVAEAQLAKWLVKRL